MPLAMQELAKEILAEAVRGKKPISPLDFAQTSIIFGMTLYTVDRDYFDTMLQGVYGDKLEPQREKLRKDWQRLREENEQIEDMAARVSKGEITVLEALMEMIPDDIKKRAEEAGVRLT